MASASGIESLASRFAEYIEELRKFFASRNVAFGAPAALPAFADTLSKSEPFREEMASMLRSVIFREGESIPRGELLELMTIAVAGTGVDREEQDMQEPVRRLFAFVNEVLRYRRTMIPDELPESESDEGSAAAFGQPATATAISEDALETSGWGEPQIHSEPQEHLSLPFEPAPQEPGRRTNDALSRAITASFAQAEAVAPEETAVSPVAAAWPAYMASERGRRHFRLPWIPRSAWMIGVAVLLTGLSVGLFLPERISGPVSGPVPVRQPSSPDQIAPNSSQAPVDAPPQTQAPSAQAVDEAPPPSAGTSLPTRPAETSREARPAAAGEASQRTTSSPGADEPGAPRVSFVSSGEVTRHLLSAPAPEYPKLASLTRVEGDVAVQAFVGTEGSVVATRVLGGPLLLRGAAEHAIRRWRYRPYLINGRPTEMETTITVSFRLHP